MNRDIYNDVVLGTVRQLQSELSCSYQESELSIGELFCHLLYRVREWVNNNSPI